MPQPQSLLDARAAFAKSRWSEAYSSFVAAEAEAALSPEDLEQVATAAFLIGEEEASIQARTRAHAAFLERGGTRGAARSAFWLGFTMFDKPQQRAQASGWLARARRLVDERGEPCVEEGWLLCAAGRQRAGAQDFDAAHDAFTRAADIGSRFGDRDLVAMARHGQGRALVMRNRVAEGLALLDEVMLSVTGGETGPIVAGIIYCSVITACSDVFDLRRANEWTDALERWCASHPELVPFRGECLIRRSELMQMHGDWEEALAEAQRACAPLTVPSSIPTAGASFYQLAELHRLRGEFDKADEAYRMASQAGRRPVPGLALLRLSQGQAEAAESAIRLALQEARDRRSRIVLLGAAVEILIARNDVASARAASEELGQLAGSFEMPFLCATCTQARGSVALAEGHPLAAAESLREAAAAWQELGAPYELARCRVLLALAYRDLGDVEGAQLELDAAAEVFERLRAAHDVARVASLRRAQAPATSDRLTGREIEVLRLIATGATNRAIASSLSISEKTVARHVSNIFTKLDLSSRAAATAYAYDHDLV